MMDNDICRKGLGLADPVSEKEIEMSSKRTFVELKIYMLRLENALYGDFNVEKEIKKEVSSRVSGNVPRHPLEPISNS